MCPGTRMPSPYSNPEALTPDPKYVVTVTRSPRSRECSTLAGGGEARALHCSFANKLFDSGHAAPVNTGSLRTRRLWPFALATKVLHFGHALVRVRFACKLF